MLFESLSVLSVSNDFIASALFELVHNLGKDALESTLSPGKIERIFDRALKACIRDYKPEKVKAVKKAFQDKRLEEAIKNFRENKQLIETDLVTGILTKALGETSAKQTAECLFTELRRLISKDQKLSHEIELLYGELSIDYLKDLQQQHKKRQDEHTNLQKSIDAIQILLRQKIQPRAIDKKIECLKQAYLKRIFDQINQYSLSWIDLRSGDSEKSNLELPALYTALLTEQVEQRELDPEKKEQERQNRITALNQLNREDRLVLLGDPGSGKSTFVDFVCLCLAGEDLGNNSINIDLMVQPIPKDEEKDTEPEVQEWDHEFLLPIRIVLRDLVLLLSSEKDKEATYGPIWQYILTQLGSHNDPDKEKLLYHYLSAGNALLFFDGLDEVPDAVNRREMVKTAVSEFVGQFPLCRYCVTSRIYAYQKQNWQLPGFATTTLAPFTPPLIFAFIEKWYQELGQRRGDTPKQIGDNIEDLKERIRRSSRLQSLAERPLLLTLMATIHGRNRTLPEKREELYAEIVDVLLNRWEKRKTENIDGKVCFLEPSLSEYLRIGKDALRRAIDELAFEVHSKQAHSEEAADIAEKDLREKLLAQGDPDAKPSRLVEFLRDRAGLLECRGQGIYRFPHRQFQEYLAACHATDGDFPDNIVDLVFQDPDKWREVVLLAGAKAGKGSFNTLWDLVEALCCKDFNAELVEDKTIGALLAAEILLESDVLERKIAERNQPKLKRVIDWLAIIVDKGKLSIADRVDAGRMLGKFGDPRPGVGVDAKTGLPEILWCPIPGGTFQMGEGNEVHPVTLDPYLISRYPITQKQYKLFVEAGGYGEKSFWKHAESANYWENGKFKNRWENDWRTGPLRFGDPFDLDNHPVVGITWYEAVAFCLWLQAQYADLKSIKVWCSGRAATESLDHRLKLLLPSEAEWEWGARGGHDHLYPWGSDESDPSRANYADTGIGTTSTVGSFPAGENPYGLLDMSGNVWEWTRSKYHEYPYRADDGREKLDSSNDARSLRGGSVSYTSLNLRCTYRGRSNPDFRHRFNGFRVVLSPVSSSVL